tara:strand:+ start:888 stop:1472 length:585 start_codon:yes stop_codon:yes gene_type:complete
MISNLPESVIEYIYEYFLGIDIYNLRITNKCNIHKKDVLNKYLHFWNQLPLNLMLLKIINIAKKIDKCKLIFMEDYQNIYNDFSIKYATTNKKFFTIDLNKDDKDLSILALDNLGRPIRLDKNIYNKNINSININIFNKKSTVVNQILYHKYEEKYYSITLIKPNIVSRHWISYSSQKPIINKQGLKVILELSI